MIQQGSSVLVTGGNGFIGRHLIRRLLTLDCRILIVDKSLDSRESSPQGMSAIGLTLSEALESQSIHPDDFDYIFHLAGNSSVGRSVMEPMSDFRSGVEETIVLLEVLRTAIKPPLLIFPSSAAVYGEPVSLPIRESDPTVPLSPYGVSKLAAENYMSVYSRLYGLRSICFRPFSLYGPHQKKQVIFDFISKLRSNSKYLEVIGDGNQQRDFFYVDDFVTLMLYACKADYPPGYSETYNAASGMSYSIRELLRQVCGLMGVTPEIVYSHVNRPGDPLRWSVDVSKIQQIGFVAATPLSTGLTEVLKWFKNDL